jgi:hypothetical protein
MREHGNLGSAAGSVPFGHLGWGYRDRAEFLRHAAAYIADGLRRNQRVAYVGEASGEALRAELTAMSRIDERGLGRCRDNARDRVLPLPPRRRH